MGVYTKGGAMGGPVPRETNKKKYKKLATPN